MNIFPVEKVLSPDISVCRITLKSAESVYMYNMGYTFENCYERTLKTVTSGCYCFL